MADGSSPYEKLVLSILLRVEAKLDRQEERINDMETQVGIIKTKAGFLSAAIALVVSNLDRLISVFKS